MEEIWKDVVGYEGLYKISNHGRLISLKYGKEKILKFGKARGYLQTNLHKNGKFKKAFIHRLVASAFIDNPDDLPQVNHKDENKTNNNACNLEWCTAKYNSNYGTGTERRTDPKRKIVIQSMNGITIEEFKSIKETADKLKMSTTTVRKCCNEKLKTSCGYELMFKNQYK